MTPAEPLVQRFRADLQALVGVPGRIGIAVSGGPDSIALLLLAKAAYGDRVEAATVDHGLRPESAAEAAFVGRVCADLSCAHAILPVVVAPGGAGLQGEARRARYAALRQWAAEREIALLCTAHHADDQAETLLMRLKRGSGLSGLAAIRPARAEGGVQIARPLLSWRRDELTAIVAEAGVAAVDDPSNRDMRFDRVAMRRFLADHADFDPARLSRSAAALREADEALEWAAEQAWSAHSRFRDGAWTIDPAGLPRAVLRRLLLRAIADLHRRHDLSPRWTGQEDVDRLLRTVETGGKGTLAGIVAAGGTQWVVAPAPARRPVKGA